MNDILDGNLIDNIHFDSNTSLDQFFNNHLLDLAELEPNTLINGNFYDHFFDENKHSSYPSDVNLKLSDSNNQVNHIPQLNNTDTISSTGLTPPNTPSNSDRSSPICNDAYNLTQHISQNLNIFSLTSKQVENILSVPVFLSPNSVINKTSLLSPVTNLTNNSQSVKKQLFPSPSLQVKTKSNQDKLNLSALRKEARKLRNRESANISRQKKKEYIKNLENEINVLKAENISLKKENNLLKHKISEIEKEFNALQSNPFVKTSSLNNKRKATLSLLALFFMIGFKFSPFTNLLMNSDDKSIIYYTKWNEKLAKENHHNGRTLLWKNSQESPFSIFDQDLDLDNNKNIAVNYNSTLTNFDCFNYMNKTESMRIDQELRGWVSRLEKEKLAINIKRKSSKVMRITRNKRSMLLTRFKLSLENELNNFNLYNEPASYLSINYQNLLKAIHPRKDTFYFLSFSAGDHFLLPAEVNKTAIRPRFSIVMPALNQINSSNSEHAINRTMNQVSMMQIDCEVMNMSMLFVNNLEAAERPQLQNVVKKDKLKEKSIKKFNKF